MRYIYRHIVRAPAKSLLGAVVALVFTLTLGFMQNTAANIRAEIDRIFDETIVNVEIRPDEDFRRSMRVAGDVVSISVLRDISGLGIMSAMYLEGSSTAFVAGLSDSPFAVLDEPGGQDILVAVNDLRHLTDYNRGFLGRDDPFNMEVQFAPGFSEDNFVFSENSAIPIVISRALAQNHGLAPGDYAHIVYYRPALFQRGDWRYSPAFVLGIHDGIGLPNIVREGAVIPLPALEAMLHDHTGFITFKFSIDPAFNRDLADIIEHIDGYLRSPIARYPRHERLRADIWDQELRFSVAPLTQHVALLELLMPVIVAVSAVIGAGFATLTMLQNAKNAAVMRVLGISKLKVRIALWSGQMIIYACGGFAGLLLTLALGLRTELVSVVVPYLGGALVGAIAGAILVTNRAPLNMLQVKE